MGLDPKRPLEDFLQELDELDKEIDHAGRTRAVPIEYYAKLKNKRLNYLKEVGDEVLIALVRHVVAQRKRLDN